MTRKADRIDFWLTTIWLCFLPIRFCLSFFTIQHSFITTTNSAGSCAHYTISGAVSCYLLVCHSSPTWLLRPTESYTTIFETPEPHKKRNKRLYDNFQRTLSLFKIYFWHTVFSPRSSFSRVLTPIFHLPSGNWTSFPKVNWLDAVSCSVEHTATDTGTRMSSLLISWKAKVNTSYYVFHRPTLFTFTPNYFFVPLFFL